MFCSKCGKQVDTSTRFCPDCGNDLSAITNAGKTTPLAAQPPQENETDLVREGLKDEYELEKELGRGGMAVVYKARDKQLDREVAIKVLPFSLSFDAEFVERFQREARTAGRLEHPNIIPIYRVGRSGRVIYFVMKFIRGKSLSAVIERGAMPVPDIKRFLTEAARALGYAHKHGIVHRDIKPDNIMFDELGQAIVADFGIAKASSGAKLTGTGMSIGTPHYMSPEQARAQNLDGRSDIYSLGVVAYQALTGHVPFDGEDSFSIGYKHIMEELPVPVLAQPDQQALFQVVQKMMAKKPDERWQSAEELIAAIEGVQASGVDMATMRTVAIEPLKPGAPRPGAPANPPTAPLPRASASMGKPKDTEPDDTKASPARPSTPKPSFRPKEITPRKSNAVPIGIAAALVLVGGGLGGYLLLNRKPQQGGQQVATNVSDSARAAMPVDSHPQPDSSKMAAPVDTAKVPSATPVTPTSKQPATSRTTTARPPATSRTSTARPPTSTAAVTPPVTAPTVTATPGATGTISLGGNIPANAVIRVDGQPKTGLRFKVPAGAHTVEVTAQGYQTYTNRVTVAPNATQSVPVSMLAGGAATTPTASATRPSVCATPNGSRTNARKECWDSPPIPNTPAVLPAPSSCVGTVTPANLFVQVSAAGEVVGTPSVTRGSNCPAFNAQAVAQIQEITFTPAKKAGVPVLAWRIIQMSPSRQ